MKHFLGIAIISSLVYVTASQSCNFDFEVDTELMNFDVQCNGAQGNWSIIDRPTTPDPPIDIGRRMLTSILGQNSCLQSRKEIGVKEQQAITVDTFFKKPTWEDSCTLSVGLSCLGKINEWNLIDDTNAPNGVGEWRKMSHTFSNPPGAKCQVQIMMYHNGKGELGIDRLTVENPASTDNCYVVTKPTEPTVTTEMDTSPTTTETATTQESSQTTATDFPSTAGTSERTGETSDLTTDDESKTTETIPETSVSSQQTSDDDYSVSSTTNENWINISSTAAQTSTSLPEPKYPEFSIFYMVIIIAASGGLAVLSACVCRVIIISKRSKKKAKLSTEKVA